MPYDLYGNHYASRQDALNAETAQCAAIDADIAMREVQKINRRLNNQIQQPDETIYYMQQHIQSLEERIAKLENIILNS